MIIEHKIVSKKASRIHVGDWLGASNAVRDFIDTNGLGSGCGSGLAAFTGGAVFDDAGKKLGRISYNGRAWGLDGAEIDLAPVTHIWFCDGVPEGFKFHSLADAEAFAEANPRGKIVPAAEFKRAA